MQSDHCSCHILMKLKLPVQTFEESSNIKFHQNPPSGGRAVPRGRTDRRDEAESFAFRNSANAPIKDPSKIRERRTRTENVED